VLKLGRLLRIRSQPSWIEIDRLAKKAGILGQMTTTLAKVRQAGGRITKDPFEFPGGRRFEYVDPAGNRIRIGAGAPRDIALHDSLRALLAERAARERSEFVLGKEDRPLSRDALNALVRQFEAHADTVTAGLARGKQGAAESFMLRGALEQARDRVIEQERMAARARAMLEALVGGEARRPLGAPPDTSALAHGHEALIEQLHQHPTLRVLDERESLARAEVDVAKSSRESDWSLEVGYAIRRPNFANMMTVMVAFELPWQAERRQDRDVAAKLAEVEQARALREDARRMHEAELRGWIADHDAATLRAERFRTVLLPLARDRASASLAAYQGGRSELTPVLEANRAVTETELALVAVEAEKARAWTNLNFQYPHEAAK